MSIFGVIAVALRLANESRHLAELAAKERNPELRYFYLDRKSGIDWALKVMREELTKPEVG